MPKPSKPTTWHEVLRYGSNVSQSTLRNYYRRYREENGLPFRCDLEGCPHPDPADWNGSAPCLILDHTQGARKDNRPHMLRYLCPNCNSQQPTHAGRNKGRTRQSSGGFGIRRGDGLWSYCLPAPTGVYRLTGNPVALQGSDDARLTVRVPSSSNGEGVA
jgi:hypothetical protein